MIDPVERERRARQNRKLSLLFTVGMMFPCSIAVGLVIGWLLDRLLGTEPWLLMLFALFGVAAGFVNLYRVVAKFDNDDDQPTPPPDGR